MLEVWEVGAKWGYFSIHLWHSEGLWFAAPHPIETRGETVEGLQFKEQYTQKGVWGATPQIWNCKKINLFLLHS